MWVVVIIIIVLVVVLLLKGYLFPSGLIFLKFPNSLVSSLESNFKPDLVRHTDMTVGKIKYRCLWTAWVAGSPAQCGTQSFLWCQPLCNWPEIVLPQLQTTQTSCVLGKGKSSQQFTLSHLFREGSLGSWQKVVEGGGLLEEKKEARVPEGAPPFLSKLH